MAERNSHDASISGYIQHPVLVNMTDSAKTAARQMASGNSSCAVVTLDKQPIGMVTEWDLLTRVVIMGRDPSSTPVSEVMSAPLWTIQSTAKIGEAVSLMMEKGFRRLVVKDEGRIIGLVSLNHLQGNNREASIPLGSLQSPKGRCPVCRKNLSTQLELSEHLREELVSRGLGRRAERSNRRT